MRYIIGAGVVLGVILFSELRNMDYIFAAIALLSSAYLIGAGFE